jgi:SAM-dependent methyltransferase
MDFYGNHKTFITQTDARLSKIIQLAEQLNPKELLDVGCGDGYLLTQLGSRIDAHLYGVDVYPLETDKWTYKMADLTKGLPFDDEMFDLIILGEVIEHVPDPDYLLEEIWRALKPSGKVIVTTPNLASWANRVLLPLGIQPLFTETSSRKKLGRRFKFLGQGSDVEGHLKIFTLPALKELIVACGFKIDGVWGVPFFFPFPLSKFDEFLTNVPSLSSGLFVLAEKEGTRSTE